MEKEAAMELARAEDLKIQLEENKMVIRAKDAVLTDRVETMDALSDELFKKWEQLKRLMKGERPARDNPS